MPTIQNSAYIRHFLFFLTIEQALNLTTWARNNLSFAQIQKRAVFGY